MSDRLEIAVAELVAALREEVTSTLEAPPELLDISSACARMGIGRSLLYSAIGRGEVRSIKIGRRRLIPAGALADFAGRIGDVTERSAVRSMTTPLGVRVARARPPTRAA